MGDESREPLLTIPPWVDTMEDFAARVPPRPARSAARAPGARRPVKRRALSGGAQEWLGRKGSLKKWQQERIAGFVKDVRAHPFPRPRRRAAAAAGAAALTARLRGARGAQESIQGWDTWFTEKATTPHGKVQETYVRKARPAPRALARRAAAWLTAHGGGRGGGGRSQRRGPTT